MNCIALLPLLAMVGTACAPTASAQYLGAKDIDALPSKAATLRESYGADSLQFGDLRLPTGAGPFPVAVIIHGGCWLARFATLQNTAALSDALRDAGIATWNIEYRRADNPGGGWPGTFVDAAAATDHLRSLATRYPLDLARVVAVGHSAGGHLALWLTARRKLASHSPLATTSPLPLAGAVSLGGPGDLAEFLERDSRGCGAAVAQLMGGTPAAVPERYRDGSPISLLPLGRPHVVIAGENDRIVPQRTRDAWAAASRQAGDSVENITIPNAAHFEVIAPASVAWPRVLATVRRVLADAPR